MSRHRLRGSWHDTLRGEPLPLDVRTAVARRVVRWTLLPLWAAGLFAVGVVLFTAGTSEPRRLLPGLVGFPLLGFVTRLARAGKWLRAAAWLNVCLFCAIALGVLANGVNAPIYGLGFLLLALVIPLFGMRVALLAGGALVGVGMSWLALDQLGLASALTQPAPTTRMGLYLCYVLLTLACLGGINRLLTDALREAKLERAQAELAREGEAASEQAFHAVFNQASAGMVLLTRSGTISRLNARAARWLGVSAPQALLGHELSAAPAWRSEQRALLHAAVLDARSGKASQHELSASAELGAQSTFQVSVSPVYADGGELGHVIVEIVEVSELVRTRTQLAQARRLDALGKLSGGVAHDINNMLAAILGAAELVQLGRRHNDPQRMDSGLQNVRVAVARASSLIKQLLAFGRQDRFDTSDIDVNALAAETGRLFERTLHKNVSVVVQLSDAPARVRGDSAALEHALLNLGLNAQDAMPHGGQLTLQVEVRRLAAAERAQLGWEHESPTSVVLRVTDTGSGMSDSVRERLFEPFFTTKPVGRGTGLGLAAVHGTVRSHRGVISVASTQQQGTSFALYFPASEHAPERPRAPSDRPLPRRLGGQVLLADDEAMVRDALAVMLTDAGCHVQVLSDGSALIEALQRGASPDLIVSDLMMPGLSGEKLVQTLRALRPASPILFVTGYIGADIAAMLGDPSRCRLLRKPISRAELLEAVAGLLPHTSGASDEPARSA